jgi:NodT family efflux transporter outer membrane factor (OMF) lipoprotein
MPTPFILNARLANRARNARPDSALRALCLVAVIAQLGACADGPTAAQLLSEAQSQVVPAHWQDAAANPANESALVSWWSQFGDATLTQLIDQSLTASNDIAAAQGRLRSARAIRDEAQGARLPSVDASGSASHTKNIDGLSRAATVNGVFINEDTYSVGLDAAWEADIFGKLRGTAEAAEAGVHASEASLYDVQRVITAEVALNYVDLRNGQARLQLAQANLDIQRENLQIAEWRNQAGLGNELDVEQARTAVGQTTAALPVLQLSITTAIQQIDVLLGKPPGSSADVLSVPAALPAPPEIIDVGLPADLLERRPDVLAAQWNLEAEVTRIGVAEADLYPALRLSGSISTSSDSVGDLFKTSLGSLVAGITAPIFEGGQIRAQIEQQKGSADTALADYRIAVLTALQDVENALQSAKAARERETALIDAEHAALVSLQLAEIRYRGGAIDFQTLLDTQRSLLTVQDSRASASADRSSAAIQLFKALGGGWPDTARL